MPSLVRVAGATAVGSGATRGHGGGSTVGSVDVLMSGCGTSSCLRRLIIDPTAGAAPPPARGGLRFESSVGGGRPTTVSARRKVRGGYSSNSAPKVPKPGVGHALTAPSSPFRCRCRARAGCAGAGSMAYVSGVAAAVFVAASNLTTARRSRCRKVSGARPNSHPHDRSAMTPLLLPRGRGLARGVGYPRLSPPRFRLWERHYSRP